MMKLLLTVMMLSSSLIALSGQNDLSQSPWHIQAQQIDPNRYFGVTVANGMIGLVSSPEPMRVNDVVLNGVYDYYQRGRVSNILKTFNHINMNLDVDGRRMGRGDISNYAQTLDMQKAALTTTYDVGDKLSVKHTLMALRHLPFTALSIVEIKAKKDVTITPMSVIETPNHLVDPRNTYSEIDRPHVLIPLLTSAAKSPSGKIAVAASTSFLFDEPHGTEPQNPRRLGLQHAPGQVYQKTKSRADLPLCLGGLYGIVGALQRPGQRSRAPHHLRQAGRHRPAPETP